MTIYFKNGETLHIAGEEGEKIKRMVAEHLEKGHQAKVMVVMNEDQLNTVDLILDIDEIAAMR